MSWSEFGCHETMQGCRGQANGSLACMDREQAVEHTQCSQCGIRNDAVTSEPAKG